MPLQVQTMSIGEGFRLILMQKNSVFQMLLDIIITSPLVGILRHAKRLVSQPEPENHMARNRHIESRNPYVLKMRLFYGISISSWSMQLVEEAMALHFSLWKIANAVLFFGFICRNPFPEL